MKLHYTNNRKYVAGMLTDASDTHNAFENEIFFTNLEKITSISQNSLFMTRLFTRWRCFKASPLPELRLAVIHKVVSFYSKRYTWINTLKSLNNLYFNFNQCKIQNDLKSSIYRQLRTIKGMLSRINRHTQTLKFAILATLSNFK